MPKKDEQIDTTAGAKKDDKKDDKKKDQVLRDDKGVPLSESDIALYKRYGKGPYNDTLRTVENDIKELNQKINEMVGIKESDTGLSLPAQWNLEQDQEMMKREETLMVGRCIQIINPGTADTKYVVSFKHIGKYVVGLDKALAPTDVEEGMRVGCE